MEQTAEEIKRLLFSVGTSPALEKLYQEVELPLIPLLARMGARGILLDVAELKRVGKKIDKELSTYEAALNQATGGGINLNSSTQLGTFLVETLKIPLGKTKTGKYATNEKELGQFAGQYLFVNQLLKYRELSKLKSTYVESLIEKADVNNVIHTTYLQIGADTGRLASTNPNLQNIPVSSPLGLAIKACFIARPGHSLVSFDYSQQELRILAHLTQEPGLIESFKQNLDVHTQTASNIFSVPYSQITPQQRSIAKTINFGIIYGMGAFGLSNTLQITPQEAREFINQFYRSYPAIKSYYDSYLRLGQKNGFVETILGRRRAVADTNDRVLMNFPIQGSAADLMKKAMVDIDREVLSNYPEISLLLQIHDDLVFEIPDADLSRAEIIEKIKTVLCSAWKLAVPLVVEVKISKKWGEWL